MAVRSAQVNVTNVATSLVGATDDDARADFDVVITNRGSASVFVGPSTVTTATGFEVAAGGTLSVTLASGERLYAIAAAAGPYRVDVLKTGAA